MNQIMVQILFTWCKIECKPMLAERVELDADNKIITVKSIPEPDYGFEE
ncbi:hypothetical protein [Peribacillus acanthi]|nr:hypothetical protein [Peribacillus acanthi]